MMAFIMRPAAFTIAKDGCYRSTSQTEMRISCTFLDVVFEINFYIVDLT